MIKDCLKDLTPDQLQALADKASDLADELAMLHPLCDDVTEPEELFLWDLWQVNALLQQSHALLQKMVIEFKNMETTEEG